MRVLFFNYEYPPLGGGAGNATYYLLREFAKIPDLEMDLVTSSVDSEYHLEKVGENIFIHYLPIGKNSRNLHFQSQKDLLVYAWKAFWFGRKLIKQKKIDLTLAFFGIPCGYIAMKLRPPYIVSLRGSDVPFYNKRFYLLDKFILRHLSKKIWKKAAIVVALSNDLVKLAKQSDPKQKILVIYNGIDTYEFKPDKNILEQEKTFNILFVGRLIERKGLIYLLKAFGNLCKIYANIRLYVVGDGPLRKTYENFVKDNKIKEKISFFGIVNHNKVAELYQKSHVFVLPSLNEALGNVTQEALATGLPIVTTNTGAAELVRDNGYIIKKESTVEIMEKLEKLISDKNLRESMGRKSREIAEQMSWEKTAQKYIELYKNIFTQGNKK